MRRGRARVQTAAPCLAAELLKEVVPLVVHEDKGREVFYLDLPHRFHAQFRVVDAFDLLDILLGEDGGRATDGAKVEAAVVLTGVGDLLAAVALLAIMISEPPWLCSRST
jgi:hypothetical protein